jgi:ELWxxDGT repeat protein/cysteine-rich repeat protein
MLEGIEWPSKAGHGHCFRGVLLVVLFALVLLPASADAALLPDGGPSPTFLRRVGDRLYFATYAAESGGWQLWTTTPSAQDSTLLKDGLGLVLELSSVDQTLVFSTRGALWRSDGTPASTVVVAELPFYPYGLKPWDGGVVFSNGRGQLWKSDLTADGTVLVRDIPPGFVFHDLTPAAITNTGRRLFFRAINPDVGNELWTTDGTSDGTASFDLQPSGGSNPGQMLNANGTLYFSANGGSSGYELWKSDGLAPNPVLVKDINPFGDAWPMNLRYANGLVYFRADDGTGPELWRSDGTADGTTRVADINPTGGSYPNGLLDVDGTVYFRADDGAHGTELWRTAGTADTTALVADVNPLVGSNPANLRVLRGRVVFTADDGTHGEELWMFDPVTGGAEIVADLDPHGGSYPHDLVRVGNRLYFAADDGTNGTQLWRLFCTGTPLACTLATVPLPAPARAPHGVPYLVRDVFPGPGDSEPYDLTASGGQLFFRAFHPQLGEELWASDGTEDGTHLVRDIAPGPDDGDPYQLTDVAGRLFFTAYAGESGSELWTSDGTESGTHLVRDVNPGWSTSYPSELTAFGDRLVFQAYREDVGREAWVSDGTEDSTVPLDLYPGPTGSDAREFTVVDGALYFVALDDDGTTWPRTKLWISDGTVEGSVPIASFRRDPPAPDLLTAVGSMLYFRGEGGGLWRAVGSRVERLVLAGRPEELTAVGDRLFFTLRTNANGRELWTAQGNAVRMVKDIDPGPADGMPGRLTNVGGTLMFWATDGETGFELWRSDGTEAGTVLVRDIDPTDVTVPSFFKAIGNVLFFSAQTPSFGYELWRSDGTTEGTAIVRNINPIASSYPESLAEVNGTLFFYAENGRTGEELWAVTPCGDGVLNPGETCDDGNTDAGDGCDAMCRIATTTATSTTITSTSITTSTFVASSTTTSAPPGSTTSTTVPPLVELCDNCVDDDGNGLVDLADPACCNTEPLTMAQVRLADDRLAITAYMPADALPTGDVAVQLSRGDERVCQRIRSAQLEKVRHGRRFRDPDATVDRVRLRLRRRSGLEIVLGAEPSPMPPGLGPLRVIAAYTTGDRMRCAAATVPLRARRSGLRFP